MSQFLAKVLLHIVYSTKGRHPWLKDSELRKEHSMSIFQTLRMRANFALTRDVLFCSFMSLCLVCDNSVDGPANRGVRFDDNASRIYLGIGIVWLSLLIGCVRYRR